MTPAAVQTQLDDFRARCADAGLAATHQRFVIYRTLVESKDHPSPELVYARVRKEIPSISQATVYKNIHTFVEIGLLREVNRLHQTNRLDANLDESPGGFQVLNYQVEAYGVCPGCQTAGAETIAH